MSRHASELTDEQWSKIEPLIPKRRPSKKGGRKRVEDRRCFEGILWVLRSGARWKDLPAQYPSPATCWRRLQEWEDAGIWLDLWRKFLGELEPRERQIVVARFGFDGQPPRTFRELGAEMGVCKERIRQIQYRAMEKIRGMAADADLERTVGDWL